MIFDMTKRKADGDDEFLYADANGVYYKRIMDITITRNTWSGGERWARLPELEEITVHGLTSETGGRNINQFSYNPNLKRLYLPDFTASNTYLAVQCPLLEEVVLGKVGTSVTSLIASYPFSGDTQSGLTITVYVADDASIPLANAPWGATNATIVYRSSTSGEVLGETHYANGTLIS